MKARTPKKEAGALYSIMSEAHVRKAFMPELEDLAEEFLAILKELGKRQRIPDRSFCARLSKEVDKLEAFLDDHGASKNKQFFYLRELVASIRWVNIAIFQLVHLMVRFEQYSLELTAQEAGTFLGDIRKNAIFYLQDMKNLGREVLKEWRALKLREKKSRKPGPDSPESMQKKLLPSDLDLDIVKDREDRVTQIMLKFLKVTETFSMFVCEIGGPEDFNEEVLEKYRSSFNSLQSLYDTYLQNTDVERDVPDLKKVRGIVSVALHLQEIGRALMHAVERHSDVVRKYPGARNIGSLLNKGRMRSSVRDFVLANSVRIVGGAGNVGQRVFTAMGVDPDEFVLETRALSVPSYRLEDFHIRPITPVTQIAGKYRVDTHLYFNRTRYDLKSALEMTIAIPDIRDALAKGNVRILIQGPRKAVREVIAFFRQKCGAVEEPIVCTLAKRAS